MNSSAASPLFLALDTSLVGVSLAIFSRAESAQPHFVWRGSAPTNAGSVAAIATLLQQGLAAAKTEAAALAGMVVSPGPGSFTGIKVGLAFAQGLRLAAGDGLKTIGIPAIEAAVEELRRQRGVPALGLLLPATRTHGFFAWADLAGARPAALLHTEISGGNAHSLLNAMPEGAALTVFGGWPAVEDWIKNEAPTGTRGRLVEAVPPNLVCDAAIYGMSLKSGMAWPTGFAPEIPAPRYLRLSTAEEKLAGGR